LFAPAAERNSFETFIDFIVERWTQYPDMHIYHFSPYEPAAMKRLMGRYATREDQIDRMLRAGLFVDLHLVVRQGLRASVETYSLKDLEAFHAFKRATDLQDARTSLQRVEFALEVKDLAAIEPEVFSQVESYNRDDCVSTLQLRTWLEGIRADAIKSGARDCAAAAAVRRRAGSRRWAESKITSTDGQAPRRRIRGTVRPNSRAARSMDASAYVGVASPRRKSALVGILPVTRVER
jgi:hypothetical protein